MWSTGSVGSADGLLKAKWARRRYYVQGDYIKPLPGERTDFYDPFTAYYGLDSAIVGRSLYLELVELDLTSESAIEEFTGRWGLLGLFQHGLVQSRSVMSDTDLEADPDRKPGYLVETFQSTGSLPVWTSTIEEWVRKEDPARDRPALDRYDDWRQRRRIRGGSIIAEARAGYYEELPFEEYYHRYFPDPLDIGIPAEEIMGAIRHLAAEYQETDPAVRSLKQAEDISLLVDAVNRYPTLGSAYLWDQLCEPLSEFRIVAAEFRDTYLLLGDRNDYQAVVLAQLTCARHLRRVHPTPTYDPASGWGWAWSFPSLLAAAYTMMFLDFNVERRKLCLCPKCGRSFVSDRSDQRYCTRRCQNAAKQQEHRRRQKELKQQDATEENESQ